MIGVLLIFIWSPFKSAGQQELVLAIYVVLASTDFLDGLIARSRFGQVTNLGKILDPMADKILILVFLPLLEMRQISSFAVFILFARDIAITSLRVFANHQGEIMAAKLSGKIRTAISFPLAGILFCRPVMSASGRTNFVHWLITWIQSWPQLVINLLIGALILITIISLVEYFGKFFAKQENRKILFEN